MNFKHLHYFWRVAKAGGVLRASEQVHVTPQTITEQIHALEDSLGTRLFERKGRKLKLTEAGQLAFDYAERIFALGAEAEAALRGSPEAARTIRFRVGVSDAVPKAIAYHLLEPAARLRTPVHFTCREWKLDGLLSELATHRLDLVIADSPIPPGISVRAFNHPLGWSGISFFGAEAIGQAARGRFPDVLSSLPMLMPGEDSAMHAQLLRWFERRGVSPELIGEFDDAALMNSFGHAGMGVFAGPTALEDEICRQYEVSVIGRTDEVRQEYYAISVERRTTHPCVVAIREGAATLLSR